jgi:[FeFe] hydrogenase H-cluster maturation GTPase HydF
MEMLPLGPVLFIDTAGIDDAGALGELRVNKTRKIFDRTDLGVLVTEAEGWEEFEDEVIEELTLREIPIIVVFNKIDLARPKAAILDSLAAQKVKVVQTVATKNIGVLDFRQALLDSAPEDFINNPVILADLVGRGGMAVFVVPIDKEAPKGRLILPQVQSIRDLLDNNSYCVVVNEKELESALSCLREPPKLVVTDSQAFAEVAEKTPREILLTSFSILFSRFRGDLAAQVLGTLAIEDLKGGDRILIAEACSHHPIEDDIGRVKIPRWLTKYIGDKLIFEHVQGHDFPDDISPYKLIIHCGACMWNRREMLSRIMKCRQAKVPISNYGLTIAYSLGILERSLEPFPAALDIFQKETAGKNHR